MWLALYDDDREDGVVNEIAGPYEDAVGAASGVAHIINETGVDHA